MGADPPPRLGNYVLLLELASGGMATVYVAKQAGAAGFERLVVIKRVHRHLIKIREFHDMLLDEARISSRIHHPNVVSMIDVVDEHGEFLLVMEYVPGVSLHLLLTRARTEGTEMPPEVVAAVFSGVLRGLHAAHEATNESSEPLHIVHRDVSPSNILVSRAGYVKVTDFGIAKAETRATKTRTGVLKGKFAYMAPEHAQGKAIDREYVTEWAEKLGVPAEWKLVCRRVDEASPSQPTK